MHPASSGRSPSGCLVVSNASTTDASKACEAPANIAAIPTSPATLGSTPSAGLYAATSPPKSAAESASNGKERRHRTTRSSAAEVDGPGDELEYDEHKERAPRGRSAQDTADVVVADTKRPRLEYPDNSDCERTNKRPPHPVDPESLTDCFEHVFNAVGRSRDPRSGKTHRKPDRA